MTTLFIGAHFDDEFLLGPAYMAALAQQGERVVIYFATYGEKGQTGGLCYPQELAQVRSQEECLSSQILGVSDVIARNFGDGQLPEQKAFLVTDIKNVLRSERPDRVITFPPSGHTGHLDHQMVQQATLQAVNEYIAEEHAAVELYYRVIPSNSDGIVNVKHDPEFEFTNDFHAAPYWGQVYGAMRAHHTQRKSMATIFPALAYDGGFWMLWPYEYFAAIIR